MTANIIKLIISISICLLAGFVGSIFTSKSIPAWYASLNKPVFNPPNWVFAPVWTTLYILMGISLYLVWNTNNKLAMIIFAVQLVLNVAWSILFFGLKSPLLAFIEIIILWIAILTTIFKFHNIVPTSAYLLIPYILWVSFAALLNYSIWMLNK